MQQKQYQKTTSLHTMKIPLQSIHSKEGPHYRLDEVLEKLSSDKQQMPYGMDTLKIPLQSIRSKEGPHYCLGAKREEAVIRQATINLFTSLDILGDSIPGLYCIAWLTQESVSSRKVKKKGMNPVQSNGHSQQKPSAKGGKGKIQ
jgi:hypothetical protein